MLTWEVVVGAVRCLLPLVHAQTEVGKRALVSAGLYYLVKVRRAFRSV